MAMGATMTLFNGMSASPCANASYTHRVDDPEHWNFCPVPESGYDAVLFAAAALLVACLANSKMIWVLVTGAVVEAFAFHFNLGHLGNAISLWLGIRPADVFIYVFLPPLLLFDAARADFFLLRKMSAQVMVMAVLTVMVSALALVPIMLYGLNLRDEGWSAIDVALFGSIIASTDAVAVSSTLASGGAPHVLSVLLEAEALFNDASSITLFEIFRQKVLHPTGSSEPLGAEVLKTMASAAWLASGGALVGAFAGVTTRWLLHLAQVRGSKPVVEVMITLAMAYLSFYVAQVYVESSGVIAVVVYGLWGSATTLWGMSAKARSSGAFGHTWTSITFALNSLVFCFVGVSCTNFFLRSSSAIFGDLGTAGLLRSLVVRLPVIYFSSFALRAAVMFATFPVLQFLGQEPVSWRDIVFATVGGVRGSLSLILAQSVVAEESSTGEHAEGREVRAQTALWAAGFVIMTLIINAPLLKPLIKWLDLDKASKEQLQVRRAAAAVLQHHTTVAIKELKESKDEMLRGVNWQEVERIADLTCDLRRLLGEGEEERRKKRQLRAARRRSLGQYAASAARLSGEAGLGLLRMERHGSGMGQRQGSDSDVTMHQVLGALPLGPTRTPKQQRQQQNQEQEQRQEQHRQRRGQGRARFVDVDGRDRASKELEEPLLVPDVEIGEAPMQRRPSNAGEAAAGAAAGAVQGRRASGSQSPSLSRRSVLMPAMVAEPEEDTAPAVCRRNDTAPGAAQQRDQGSKFGRLLEALHLHDSSGRLGVHEQAPGPAGGGRDRGGVLFAEPGDEEDMAHVDILGLGEQGVSARISEQDQRLQRLQDSLFDEDEVCLVGSSGYGHPSSPGGGGDVEAGDVSIDTETGDAFAAAAAPPAGTAATMGNEWSEDEDTAVDMPDILDVWSPTMAVVPINLGPGSGREGTLMADGAAGGYTPGDVAAGEEVATHYNLLRLRSDGMWDFKDGGQHVQRGLSAIRKAFSGSRSKSMNAMPPSEYAGSVTTSIKPSIEQVLEAYRVKLYAGFKRYFFYKNSEGLLGHEGLRILGYCCDVCLEEPAQPLHLWSVVEREALRSPAISLQHRALIWCKRRAVVLRSKGTRLGGLLATPFVWSAEWLNARIDRATVGVLELAIELWLALLNSPQSKLLERSSVANANIRPLMQEVQQEAEKVWWFILHREVEAPGRFQAIQTFRAQRAVLAQQLGMIEELAEQGVLDEADAEALVDLVEARILRVQRRGPRWRQVHVSQMLQESIAFKGVSPLVFDYMRAHSTVCAYKKGTLIFSEARSRGSAPGFYLVISGMVRIITRRGATLEQHYQGTGTVFGLVMTLVGRPYPQFGLKEVYAEGNALGKGPVIMHVPAEFIERVRERARAGNQQCRQLETSLFLFAANIIFDLMRGIVVQRLVEHIKQAYFSIMAEPVSAEVRHKRLMALLQPNEKKDADEHTGHNGRRKRLGTHSRLVDTLHELLQEAEEKEKQEQESEEVEELIASDEGEAIAEAGMDSPFAAAEQQGQPGRGKEGFEGAHVQGQAWQEEQQQEGRGREEGQEQEEQLPQALLDAMKERAVAVWDSLRALLGQRGMLLVLAPQETFMLRNVAVLMDGSITEDTTAEAPSAVAAAAQVHRGSSSSGATAVRRSQSMGGQTHPPHHTTSNKQGDSGISGGRSRSFGISISSSGRSGSVGRGGSGARSSSIGRSGGGDKSGPHTPQSYARPVLKPPAVLAWLPSQLHSVAAQQAAAAADEHAAGGLYRAGPRGAVVVTCLEADFATLLKEGIFKGSKGPARAQAR